MFRIFPTIWHNGNTGRLNLHSASGTEWRFGLPVMIADNGIVQSLGARAGLITPRRRGAAPAGGMACGKWLDTLFINLVIYFALTAKLSNFAHVF